MVDILARYIISSRETWNGSAWTEVEILNTARGNLGACWNTTAALAMVEDRISCS